MRSTKTTGILILSLAVLIALAGATACQKKAETAAAEVQQAVTEFEGTVRAALGSIVAPATSTATRAGLDN